MLSSLSHYKQQLSCLEIEQMPLKAMPFHHFTELFESAKLIVQALLQDHGAWELLINSSR